MKNKGFTLIEMLIVIAMVGILSTAILVALGPSRTKAKDTRIISDINQMRLIIENLYDSSKNRYTVPNMASPECTGGTGSGELDQIMQDVAKNGGSTCMISLADDGSSYAILVKLASGSWYCVDSRGVTSTGLGGGGICK